MPLGMHASFFDRALSFAPRKSLQNLRTDTGPRGAIQLRHGHHGSNGGLVHHSATWQYLIS
jgi:hypothetical protein